MSPSQRDRYEEIFEETLENKNPKSYFEEINRGWVGNFNTIKRQLNPKKSYLVIHALEPTIVMDLRSAEQFRRAATALGLVNLSSSSVGIGHVFVSWRCNIEGQMVEGATGMSGESSGQFNELIENGWGLSSFLARYRDGHLQSPRLLEMEWDEAWSIHSLAVEVSPEVCGRARSFVYEFLAHPKKPANIFGLGPNPEKFEGGGCGSFGVSVLNRSGIFGDSLLTKFFWRDISTRESLFGYGLDHPESVIPFQLEEGENWVSSFALLASDWDGEGPSLRIMDPEMILLFLKSTYRIWIDELYVKNSRLARAMRASELYAFRKLRTENAHWPEETQRVDSNYDSHATRVVGEAKRWSNRLRSQGYGARPIWSGKENNPTPAMVLEKR